MSASRALLSGRWPHIGSESRRSHSINAAWAMADAADISAPANDGYARLLCSFVPNLLLKSMDQVQAALEPPATHEYSAVALFAV